MTDITWGREIPVNGVRPTWLADDTFIQWADSRNTAQTRVGGIEFGAGPFGNGIHAIRLPANHFAYLALDKGFEPWGGGDAAPDDWDGDLHGVLYRDGQTAGRAPSSWTHYGYGSDIIGYHKRAKPAVFTADTVPVARMTKAEALERFELLDCMAVLAQLGLIREETRAERFNRETGHDLTPAVLAALEYER